MGRRGVLREALRGADAVLAFRRHPRLRRERTFLRFFWRRSHGLLALALLGGAAASGRHRTAAILAARYLLDLAHRCRARGGGTSFLPWLALCDALEVATAARGSLRHRVVLLRAPARVRGRESRIGSKPLAAY